MGELLNEVTTTESITTYDRSYAGGYENPYGGRPALLFHMHRVTVRNADDTVIATSSLPNVREPYTPGKTYDMFNPATGAAIPGATFTSDQAYAFIYSMMMRALADQKAFVDAQAALNTALVALAAAQATYDAAVALPADQPTIDAAAAAVTAAQATVTSAQAAVTAAQAALA
jgi:hypothetical protein